MEIIRIQSFHATIIFLIFIYGFGTPTGYGRSNDLHLFHLGAKTVDVGRFQIPPSPFAEAFVSLARSLRDKETGIGGKSLLQAVDTAVEMNRNGDHGLPVPNYTDENVSAKVVKIIQSYTGVVNKMVWRKF